MYIWTAIDVNDQLINQKEEVKKIERKIKFDQSNISLLPLHISLKISSDVSSEVEKDIRKDIEDILSSIEPFTCDIEGINKEDNIVWIKIKENENLINIHDKLCHLFKDKYNISLNEIDNEFTYHVTLFLDSDERKINKSFMMIKDIKLPETLLVNKFVIGSSIEGSIGTYKVDTTIKI